MSLKVLETIEFQGLWKDQSVWVVGLLIGKAVVVAIKFSFYSKVLVVIAIVLLVALTISFSLSSRALLDNSLNAVGKNLGITYEVKKKTTGDSFTDLSGIWAIQSNGDLAEVIATRSLFAKADIADLEYFKQQVVGAIGSGEALDGYMLYRAELPLGDGTICSTLPCENYVLVKARSSLAYIGIYRI